MILRNSIIVLLALFFCGCAEHVDIAEPLDVPPVDIELPPDITGEWERTENFVDTITITLQDSTAQTLPLKRTWITLLELTENRFVVSFFDNTDGQRHLFVRREGEIVISGDTLMASVYSSFPHQLLRQSVVRFEDQSRQLILTQIFDSGDSWLDRYLPPTSTDDIYTGEGIFWLRSAPHGDFGDRKVRELGTFQRSK
ncbi:MAG: hypothetical protein GY841_07520 [FCB group bacterium]|nr:hypothetical protein [FCB group bacterium]